MSVAPGANVGCFAAWLVEHAPALELHVLAVRVGEQVLPDAALARERPQPDLAAVLLRRVVVGPERRLGPPHREDAVVAVEHVVALRVAEGVVAVHGEVTPLRVHVPGMRVAVVADVGRAGERERGVAARRVRGRHPVVVGSRQVRAVEPGRAREEVVGVGREVHLHLPGGAVDVLRGGGEIARAAVGVLPHRPVHGRGGGGRVAHDAEIVLDAARAPGAAHRDVAERDGVVEVDELASGRLVERPPHLAADLREHRHAHAVVLQRHACP